MFESHDSGLNKTQALLDAKESHCLIHGTDELDAEMKLHRKDYRAPCWEIGACRGRNEAVWNTGMMLHATMQKILCNEIHLMLSRNRLKSAEALIILHGVHKCDKGAFNRDAPDSFCVDTFIFFVGWQLLRPRESVFVLCHQPRGYSQDDGALSRLWRPGTLPEDLGSGIAIENCLPLELSIVSEATGRFHFETSLNLCMLVMQRHMQEHSHWVIGRLDFKDIAPNQIGDFKLVAQQDFLSSSNCELADPLDLVIEDMPAEGEEAGDTNGEFDDDDAMHELDREFLCIAQDLGIMF